MPGTLSLKQGQSVATDVKLMYLFELRDMMEQGFTSITKICEAFNISRDTASNWRKQALLLTAKDDNGFTREGIRNIQIGRIQYMIERLQVDLEKTTDVDVKVKLHDRIVKYYDSLARITGLNSEVQINVHTQLKPLTIVRPTLEPDVPVSHNVMIDQPTDTAIV